MRPDILNPLYASAQSITGVGPRVLTFLRKALRLPPGVTEPRVVDLVWHTPTGIIDRRAEPTVAAGVPGTIATFKVRVIKHKPSHYLKMFYLYSACYWAPAAESALKSVGEDHFLFGTDSPPMVPLKMKGLNMMKEIGMNERQREKVMGGNAARLLKLK